ncbi:Zn-dependent peptidase ImmA, M78 family [Rubritalea squalenifaciens DSM 18772]|uniref:Zn-dependent peptidase ImmA, M78 family n=1 Tax=Rubritalea squalenifaciens DSM 18772 TaxID=1123071 RepID=A0A1M6GSV8_9BACT|nr:XRE family transcriptional regulator [Rubritalea squalenifaciens]SHJ13054.1 Zn-dependent peptidase ImmA, M78 family [Rubritalea squalenifaciens DSM 18772]
MSNDLTIFGRRLKQARKMRGWSLAQLREQIGQIVSIAALSKYEKGQSMASSKVLVALSEALDVSLDYLFRDFEVDLDRIRFRKMSTLPKKEQNRVIEEARDFFERYFEIEELVDPRPKFESPIKSSLTQDYEAMADLLRKKWNIGEDPIPNVHALLEEKGIKVWYAKNCDEKFDGFSAETNRGPVIVVSAQKTAARKRMTALHELAHILCEPMQMDEKEEEKFVKGFTGAILLPKNALYSMLGNSRKSIPLGELLEIKKRYGISMGGIVMRAVQLDILPQDYVRRFFGFGPGKDWRKREPWDNRLGRIFPETHVRYRQLVFRAYGEDLITISQAANYLGCSIEEANQQLNAPFFEE